MIFSFSGTGNSNYIAQRMADALGNPALHERPHQIGGYHAD